MKQLDHKPAQRSSGEALSFSEVSKEAGLVRFDIRECIELLRENPDVNIDVPPKVENASLEALLIESIWNDIQYWIDSNPDSRGLSNTNVPHLYAYMRSSKKEKELPKTRRDLECTPLTKTAYEQIVCCDEEYFLGKKVPTVAFVKTRNLAQTKLLDWELQRKEEPQSCSSINRLYHRYVTSITRCDKDMNNFNNPATRKMQAGFAFGQSVYWHLPDSAHQVVVSKLGVQHLSVIHEILSLRGEKIDIPLDTEVKPMRISRNFLSLICSDPDSIASRQKKARDTNADLYSDITTQCPAFFTDAFEGIGVWIRSIRRDIDAMKAKWEDDPNSVTLPESIFRKK